MSSPQDRNRVDAWLNAEVEPLAPPPGTFGRIRRRARRRKVGRALMSGAGVVIVIAAAVAVPRIVPTLLHSHNAPRRAVAEGSPPSVRPSPPGTAHESVNASASPAATQPQTSALTPGGSSGQPVPSNFQPTSVTFISQETGAVIGQAGTPGHCGPPKPDICTSLAGTSTYGSTWYGVSAPVTGAPDGSSGVGQLRFLNAHDGWAFGPELWVTHDGGATWSREQTHGMRVIDLEAADGRALAIFASCAGTGRAYAADCSSFALYSSQAESNEWQPMTLPASSMRTKAGQPASASLVLGGMTGYLLTPSGKLISGPIGMASWGVATGPVVLQHVPCLPGAPGSNGQPAALLAANSGLLVLVCTRATSPVSDTQTKVVLESNNAGVRWSVIGAAPKAGIAASVAIQVQSAGPEVVVLATDAGIYQSADGGKSWHLAQPSPDGASPAGFSYVGMTSPANGVALPADASLHEVYVTTDGGGSWVARPVSRP
jgi:photosystem II stability/assembly factor-like uncharacterized protein